MKRKNNTVSYHVGEWTVTVDRTLCIGAASCVAVAPDAFELDSEAKAIVKDTAKKTPKEVVFDAAQVCPVAAIIITETKTGKRIFPK